MSGLRVASEPKAQPSPRVRFRNEIQLVAPDQGCKGTVCFLLLVISDGSSASHFAALVAFFFILATFIIMFVVEFPTSFEFSLSLMSLISGLLLPSAVW